MTMGQKPTKNLNGFTIVELVAVLLTIGVVTAIAVPSYVKSQDKARAAEARVNLYAIYMAEKIYQANQGSYWTPGSTDLNTINRVLNIELSAKNYTAGIAVNHTASGYEARFAQLGNASHAFVINQTGGIQET